MRNFIKAPADQSQVESITYQKDRNPLEALRFADQ